MIKVTENKFNLELWWWWCYI